jgi:hypothetical protein
MRWTLPMLMKWWWREPKRLPSGYLLNRESAHAFNKRHWFTNGLLIFAEFLWGNSSLSTKKQNQKKWLLSPIEWKDTNQNIIEKSVKSVVKKCPFHWWERSAEAQSLWSQTQSFLTSPILSVILGFTQFPKLRVFEEEHFGNMLI